MKTWYVFSRYRDLDGQGTRNNGKEEEINEDNKGTIRGNRSKEKSHHKDGSTSEKLQQSYWMWVSQKSEDISDQMLKEASVHKNS